MSQHDLDAIARTIVHSNLFMTVATADATGRPWASPVYYASANYAEFLWVSSPDALHSRNLATRPEVSIVVFDSRAQIGEGQAVYITAVAAELTGTDLERWILDPGDHPIHGRTGDHRTPVRP